MDNKEYFNKVADQWDDMRTEFFGEALREKAIKTAGVVPGEIAADVGAGTGFMTNGLLEKGLEVIGIDHSEKMIGILKSKFQGYSARFHLAESNDLTIDSGSVDYVFANMYLHHVEDPSAAIKEMARILKKNGRLVISDVDTHNHEFLLKEHHDRWPGFKREDIKKWFEQAGLADVKVDCAGEDCCAESEDSSDKAEISIFIASGRL
ncbi:MAG: class I SAM-dependent methyltransferase [bacterium]|nr:class I SAM-dependent methyltransferase [bacterium]